MTKATLHFCKPKSKLLIFSPIIMALQNLKYSHSVIEHEGYIFESTFPFAKKTKAEEWKKKYVIVESHDVMVDVPVMISMLGKYYSLVQLIWAWLNIKTVLNDIKGLICTEYCARAMGFSQFADDVDLKDLKDLVFLQKDQLDF